MIVARHELRYTIEKALFDTETEIKAVEDLDSFSGEDLDKLLEIRQNLKNSAKLLAEITWIE
jgi:Zn-dependent M32 family carboxypeptidase